MGVEPSTDPLAGSGVVVLHYDACGTPVKEAGEPDATNIDPGARLRESDPYRIDSWCVLAPGAHFQPGRARDRRVTHDGMFQFFRKRGWRFHYLPDTVRQAAVTGYGAKKDQRLYELRPLAMHSCRLYLPEDAPTICVFEDEIFDFSGYLLQRYDFLYAVCPWDRDQVIVRLADEIPMPDEGGRMSKQARAFASALMNQGRMIIPGQPDRPSPLQGKGKVNIGRALQFAEFVPVPWPDAAARVDAEAPTPGPVAAVSAGSQQAHRPVKKRRM